MIIIIIITIAVVVVVEVIIIIIIIVVVVVVVIMIISQLEALLCMGTEMSKRQRVDKPARGVGWSEVQGQGCRVWRAILAPANTAWQKVRMGEKVSECGGEEKLRHCCLEIFRECLEGIRRQCASSKRAQNFKHACHLQSKPNNVAWVQGSMHIDWIGGETEGSCKQDSERDAWAAT